MKFAILALVGGASALKAYTDVLDCTDTAATPMAGEVKCFGTGKTYSATNGNQAFCSKVTRGQKTTLLNIVSGDFGGVYDTKTNAGKAVWGGVAAPADNFGSSCAYLSTGTPSGSNLCGGAGPPAGPLSGGSGAAIAGYQIWSGTISNTSPVKLDIGSPDGAAALYGALLCPQAKDTCGADWGAAKVKDFTAATAAPVDVKLGALDDSIACSYVIRAKCEAPYMQTLTGVTAEEAKVTWTILEYGANAGQGLITKAHADTINAATTPAHTTLTYGADLGLLPKESATPTENAGKHTASNKGEVGQQGLNNAGYPKVRHVRFKGDQSTGVPVDSYLLFEAIAAKKAEYAAYTAAKAAYDTKRTDYDTKLDAAQVILDAQKKDIFKAWFPSEADKTALAAVPKRPIGEKPALPAAFTGPVAVAKATPATDQVPGLLNDVAAALSAPWQGPAPIATYLDVDGGVAAGQSKNLVAGKSWGTMGYGSSDTCDQTSTIAAPCTAAAAGSMTGVGVRFAGTDLAATPACPETFMAVQVGVKTQGDTAAADGVTFRAGIKPYKWTLDAPVAPAAAVDPKTPAGAKMLSLGAAALFATMTLF